MIYKVESNQLNEVDVIKGSGIFFIDIESDEEIESFGNCHNVNKMINNKIVRFEDRNQTDVIVLPAHIGQKETLANMYVVVEDDLSVFIGKKVDFLEHLGRMKEEGTGTTVAMQINRMFYEISNLSYISIGSLEEDILKLEDRVISNETIENASKEILKYRRSLLAMKNGFYTILDVLDSVLENDNNHFSEDELRRFEISQSRLERNNQHILSLLEYVTEVREAYQSQVDMRQNDIMRLFTIISAIFLPLTLLVGWYGMNFKLMPELDWAHGYPVVIVLSIAIVVFCVYYFKKNKWF